MIKFSKWACSFWSTVTSSPVLSGISSPYLAECPFLPRRGSSRWGSTLCHASQTIPSGFPDRSCSAVPLFHSWEDQDRPQSSCKKSGLDVSTGFPVLSWLETDFPGSWYPHDTWSFENWSWLPIQVQFSYFLISILSVEKLDHLEVKYILDKPLSEIV